MILDPPPITPAQCHQREAARVRRITDLVAHSREELAEQMRRKAHDARYDAPGAVWQVDGRGKVIAKYLHGRDASKAHGVHINTINLSIRETRPLGDGRRFIRL